MTEYLLNLNIEDTVAPRYVYPVVFSIILLILSSFMIKKLIALWMKTVRDDTYLVGKRLHNMQNLPEQNASTS